MTSKNHNDKKNFNYTITTNLPKLGTIKNEWDLKKQYYISHTDPQIEADVLATEKALKNFAKKWRSKKFTTDVRLLKQALTESEVMSGNPTFRRPMRYFSLVTALNTADSVAEKHISLIGNRLRKASNQVLFFTLELGKISKAEQKKLINHADLTHFRYYLEELFASAKYHLTEDQEKIISLKSRQSYGRWVDMTDKIISQRHIVWKDKSVALPEAIEMVNLQTFANKPKLWGLIADQLEQISEIAEHEFNAIITDVRTEDELRGYKKPYSATVLNYQDNEIALERLLAAVTGTGFKLSHKFYKLKAKYHGVEKLEYSQRNESAGESVSISYDQAVTVCRDVFYGVHKDYGEFFDSMLENGQIDVWPKPGKTGGAFMSAENGHPTNVMLNHVTNFQALETLAHEMGHAIHAMRSKKQTPFYSNHSIVTAETASTLFENLVFDAVFAQVSNDEKAILLHDRILRDISTIQRQIAFFNAELEIHNTIHLKGGMSGEELRNCMQKHLQSYLGAAVNVTEKDGYTYVYVGHLRYGFYVYSYAYGLMMSSIMSGRYREDNNYVEKIDEFLSLGESMLIKNIYMRVGIDTSKIDTFENALKKLGDDIAMFDKLLKKKKKPSNVK